MAVELTTQAGSLPPGGTDDFDVSPPAGTPNVDGMGKDDIAGLLREANAGGSQAKPVTPPVSPDAPKIGQDPLNQVTPEVKDPAVPEPTPEAEGKPKEEEDPLANVYKKFGVTEPNEAVAKMAKSYAEAEKTLSQNFQAKSDAEKFSKENEQLLNMAEDFQKEISDLKKAPSQSKSDPNAEMTDKEIEEYNSNPKAAIAKAVQAALEPIQAKSADQQKQGEQDRVMDYKVLSEINRFKGDQKFSGLEKDADTILNDKNLPYTPQSVALAYHAARSVRMADIVNTAKNEAFTTGYNKAMDEIKRGVDGGKSTIPAQGSGGVAGLDEASLDSMPASDLAKLLPNAGI